MFAEKFPQLKSMIGKEAITAEEVASLNLELQDKGVSVVSFVPTGQENALEEVQATLAETQTQLTEAQTNLTNVSAERDALKAELEGAAENRTSVSKDKDKGAEGKHPEWNDPNAEYNQRARAATGK